MVSLSNHVAISMRLNTCRRAAIATATRCQPPHRVRARNDKVGTNESEAGIGVAPTVPRRWPRVRIAPDECYFDRSAKKAAAMVTATASLLVITNRADCACQFVPGVT